LERRHEGFCVGLSPVTSMNELKAIHSKPALQVVLVLTPLHAIARPVWIQDGILIPEAKRRRASNEHDDLGRPAASKFNEAPDSGFASTGDHHSPCRTR